MEFYIHEILPHRQYLGKKLDTFFIKYKSILNDCIEHILYDIQTKASVCRSPSELHVWQKSETASSLAIAALKD